MGLFGNHWTIVRFDEALVVFMPGFADCICTRIEFYVNELYAYYIPIII